MRQVVESYLVLWLVLLLLFLGIGFTSINIHTSQARRVYNDIKAEVQASNGTIVPESGLYNGTQSAAETVGHDYIITYMIERQSLIDSAQADSDETFIYNDIYKITLVYTYAVPLLGKQQYAIVGFTA